MTRQKKTYITIFLISIFLCSSFLITNVKAEDPPEIKLILRTNDTPNRIAYAEYIRDFCAEIGIEIEIVLSDFPTLVNDITTTYNYDLVVLGLSGGATDPDRSGLFRSTASLNMFGLNTSMPYGQLNDDMIDEGLRIMNLEDRQQHYYEWQQLLMDKLLPMTPLFSPMGFEATWSNLQGYDENWGIANSLPYMSWNGLHQGQVSTDQFVTYDGPWLSLNPVFSVDAPSNNIQKYIYEPTLQMSPGFEPLKSGLINNWEWIDENNIRFTIRNDIYWNPSYNLTGRTAESDPLHPSTTPLLTGLKDNSVSDGTNQHVTSKDFIFTYLALASDFSVRSMNYDWMKSIYAENDYNFVITIDGDYNTPELEPYAPFWASLSQNLLPEFFLNSTSTTPLMTRSGIEYVGLNNAASTEQWILFNTMGFGCGKYMLDWSNSTTKTELQASPYWIGNGAIDGTPQTLDIDKVIIQHIENPLLALAEFQSGNIDYMFMNAFLDERKMMETNSSYSVYSKALTSYNFLGFNLRSPIIGGDDNYHFLTAEGKEEYTKASAVRKAISYAIDRTKMINELHDGEMVILDSPIFPMQEFWYYEDIVKYNRNLDLAKEWLLAAGYGVPIDNEPPTISNLNITPLQPTSDEQITISATVQDNIEVWNVTLHYRINGDNWQTVNMVSDQDDDNSFSTTIGPFATGDFLEFYIATFDSSGNEARTNIESVTIQAVPDDDDDDDDDDADDSLTLPIPYGFLGMLAAIFILSNRRRN